MSDSEHHADEREQTVSQYRGRLARMEAVVESLVASVQQQAKAQAEYQANAAKLQQDFQRDIRGDVREFQKATQKAIESLADKVSSHGRVSWPLVASVVFGVVSSFIGTVGTLLVIGAMSLSPLAKGIDSLRASLAEHAALEGHPYAMEKHAAYGERFETIRTDLQHIRDLADANAADLESRAGMRFNRPDWERAYDTVILPLDARVQEIEATRFKDSDGEGVLERITRAESALQFLRTLVDEVRAEQTRRTERVYRAAE